MRREWESAKLIWQTMGYAATLTLLSASRVSSNDQWLGILSQWAVMMFVVVIGRVGWVICIQIADETRRVLQAQKAKESHEIS